MDRYLQLAKYYPPIKGGIELVEKMMTKSLVELGHEVTVISYSKNTLIRQGEFKENVFEFKENLNVASAPFSISMLTNLKKIIIERKINKILVHLPNPQAHEMVKMCKGFFKKNNVEVIAVYHSDIVNKKIFGDIYNFYFKLTSQVYSKWIVSSENLVNSSNVLNSIDKDKFIILPFCSEGLLNFNKRSGFNNKIVTIGRMVPYKGFDFLIETLKKTQYELHIIGGGPLFHRLYKLKSENIFFHQNATEVEKANILHQASVVVIGSLNNAEAYGMTIVEAFESGLMVIAPDLPTGVTYLVQDKQTGLVYKRRDEKDLIEKLNQIASDSKLYENVTYNARKFYEDHLSFEVFKNGMKRL